jgi:hypothetical protein
MTFYRSWSYLLLVTRINRSVLTYHTILYSFLSSFFFFPFCLYALNRTCFGCKGGRVSPVNGMNKGFNSWRIRVSSKHFEV